MATCQNKNEFNVNVYSDEESIIDRMISEIRDVTVKIRTMTVIENLSTVNVYRSSSLLSHLLIKYSSIVTSLIGLSGKMLVVDQKVKEIVRQLTRSNICWLIMVAEIKKIKIIKTVLKDPTFVKEPN